jgi:hypothetical protein
LRAEHLNESLRNLPGPAYYRVLNWIHQFLKPDNYFEIGVHKGTSIRQTPPDTRCIGVDPQPNIQGRLPDAKRIYELTSDDFFERYDLRELLGGPVQVAFIDGLHLFEQVLRDFVNLERSCDPDTVVLLHDCIPLDAETASRERTTDFFSGDVWKAVLAIRRERPDLQMVMVPTAPTGLCLVRGLDRDNRVFERRLPEIVDAYRELDFDYYAAHRDEMPPQIANQVKAVGDWLRATRTDQS